MVTLDEIKRSIEQMPVDEITPIVRNAIGDDSAAVERGWTAEPMSVLSIGNGTLGFLRVEGTTRVGARIESWSAVVKVIDPEDFSAGSPTFQNAGNELAALTARELREVQTGLRPVPVYSVMPHERGISWLWMKDLSSAQHPPWNAETHIRVARHMGEFNALWPEHSRPYGSWISTNYSESRSEQALVQQPEQYELLRNRQDHPYVRSLAKHVGIGRVTTMLDDAETVVKATRNLPKSVAHQDCHARNIFPWIEDGTHVTYAVDWASVGLAPVGADAGSLSGGGMWWGQAEVEIIAANETAMFESYFEGLNDNGWEGNKADVRLGYLGQVTSYVIMLPFVVALIVSDHPRKQFILDRVGADEATASEQMGERLPVFIPLLEEAVELARQLG